MYHIKSDRRSQKSAHFITEGLLACLKEKPLSMISITDLSKKSYISRSTFYRLFDNIEDVLVYMLENSFRELADSLEHNNTANLFTRAIEICYDNPDLIKVIFQANKYDLLFTTYEKMMNIYLKNNEPASGQNRVKIYYNFAILAGLLIGTLHAWVKDGQKETIRELCSKASTSIEHLQRNFMI